MHYRDAEIRVQGMLVREHYVRVKVAASLLGVAPNTVRSWGADGKIPEYRHPVNNYRLYKRTDLEKLLKRLEQSVSREAAKARRTKPK